jgi:hypothetical protein
MAKSLTLLICVNQQEGNLAEARRLVEKLNVSLAATTGVLEPHHRAELVKIGLVFHDKRWRLTENRR